MPRWRVGTRNFLIVSIYSFWYFLFLISTTCLYGFIGWTIELVENKTVIMPSLGEVHDNMNSLSCSWYKLSLAVLFHWNQWWKIRYIFDRCDNQPLLPHQWNIHIKKPWTGLALTTDRGYQTNKQSGRGIIKIRSNYNDYADPFSSELFMKKWPLPSWEKRCWPWLKVVNQCELINYPGRGVSGRFRMKWKVN